MRVLIIAQARYKGGLSGSDAIYESFVKYWPAEVDVWTLKWMDFKPFAVCYVLRILVGLMRAVLCFKRYDLIYSASDFLMDSLPALLLNLRGSKWLAGFFLFAMPKNPFYRLSQRIATPLIRRFSDMMVVTNESMYGGFPDKLKTWINGGIEFDLIPAGERERIYDAVFCGRIHPSKGIDDLLCIWKKYRRTHPKARMALIGDGDLGVGYLKRRGAEKMGIELFGYMGNERYEVFLKSKVVLYPAKIDHFSIAPVEAMACGCPMVAYNLPAIALMKPKGAFLAKDKADFVRLLEKAVEKFDDLSPWAERWSHRWGYRKQAMRVFNDVQRAGLL